MDGREEREQTEQRSSAGDRRGHAQTSASPCAHMFTTRTSQITREKGTGCRVAQEDEALE